MSAGSFVAITSEGGMLPADFLQDLVRPGTSVDGLTPASYHLAEGERLSEQVNRSWNRLKGCWANFRKATADKQPGDSTTTETRERWLQPLFQELGFGQKLAVAKPIEVDGRSYPVSHGWGAVPIHLVGSHVDIDRRTPGAIGAAKASPHSLVQQTLNASDHHMWGIVSNGLVLRLLRDNVTLTRMAYLEWDLAAIFDGDLYSEFFLLWLLCHQSRFEGERPDQCWLEKWKKEASDKSFRALEDLRPGVESAISSLGAGFISHPANKALLEKLRSGELSTQEFYRQILRVVYRMIFLFVAEDRGLLHPPLPDGNADEEAAAIKARQRYADFYALSRLRNRSFYRTGTPHPDLWAAFQLVTQKLGSDTGSAELALPPLGSFLWDSRRSTPDLDDCLITNRHFLSAVHSLAFVKSGGVRRSVDYRNLGAEEIGAVYEGLLELHPDVNATLCTFELDTAAGNERKTSGSYYTPDALVQFLLDTALDPVIDQAVAGKSGDEAAEAILSLKVCDPAVGSGHFLIAAAHRMARRVAASQTGEEEPSPEANRTALREVIGRCLYGVDINPMSAELCRVSLWLEALEPGKPLSFLDHHIQVGNSLLGATRQTIEDGIPDVAFKPLSGDDADFCKAAKKQNKEERRGQLKLFYESETSFGTDLADLLSAARDLESISDATPEALQTKEDRYQRLVGSDTFTNTRFIADAWCAALVWEKRKSNNGGFEYAITNGVLRDLQRNPRNCPTWMREEITRLRDQYNFFHWHLAFPEVFPAPEGPSTSEEVSEGVDGGFDAIIGNPPWEKITVIEQEFFGSIPEIANEQRANRRKQLIKTLAETNPVLFQSWQKQLRHAEYSQGFLGRSNRYPLTAVGELNLFPIFTELATQLVKPKGHIGLVVKSSLLLSPTWSGFTSELVGTKKLRSAYDFRNWNGWFPNIGYHERFTLLHIGHSHEQSDDIRLGFYFDEPSDIGTDKFFQLTSENLLSLNPLTKTLPVFDSQRSKDLLLKIHARFPILSNPTSGWNLAYTAGFHMSGDADLLKSKEELFDLGARKTDHAMFVAEGATYVPVMEGKLLHQCDPRFATFEGIPRSERFGRKAPTINPSPAEKGDASYTIEPRYWISSSEVAANFERRGVYPYWAFTFRDTTNVISNFRTAVGAICSGWCFNYKAPNLVPEDSVKNPAQHVLMFIALFNSFPFDYVVRQKFFGANLIKSIIDQIAAPSVSDIAHYSTFIDGRALELAYSSWELLPFASDVGWDGPPFRWDDDRRFVIRCELDAALFHIYGLERDDVAYVLDTFPIIRRKDEEKHGGAYRTKDTILEIYDAMQSATATGQPYQTRLDPPPGPPIGKDGKFVKYEDIAANPPPHIHLPRGAKPANNEWQLTDLAREFPRSPFKLRTNGLDGILAVQPVKPSAVASGDHVVIAHLDLHRGQKKLAAVTGRIVSIANRQDAATNEPFVHLAVQDTEGVVELRMPAEEWSKFESIGIIKNS